MKITAPDKLTNISIEGADSAPFPVKKSIAIECWEKDDVTLYPKEEVEAAAVFWNK